MVLRLINRGVLVFGTVWFGQLISLIGTNLTGFALGVWVYQRTGSVTRFALISVCTMLPGMLLSPIVGAFVDRWDRRSVMIFGDSGAAVSTLAIALLLLNNQLEIWHIYLATAISSLFNAFQAPAFTASITLLIPKKHLGRASGMLQLSEAASQIASPFLGGMLLVMIEIWGVILIDFATFLFSLITLLLVRIPKPEKINEIQAKKPSLLQEVSHGWKYIAERPGLFALLVFLAFANVMLGFVVTLITPLVLGFASSVVLGSILSIGGLGMLLGSLVMSVWGGPQNRIMAILGFTLVRGLLLFLGGIQPNVFLIATAAFVFLVCDPFVFACDLVIWQNKVAHDVQGRVLAIHHAVIWMSWPLAALVSGPLADFVFEPLLAPNGLLAQSVGKIIGVGPGRGIGLLFIIMAILTVLATVIGYLYRPLRLVEKELPDHESIAKPA